MTPEIEALRIEVAALAEVSREAAAALEAAEARLCEMEDDGRKAAFLLQQPDAVCIGGHWVAALHRTGPRRVTGLVLDRNDYGWCWCGRQSLMSCMRTDEDRAVLLAAAAAAGTWPR